jgi:hypothetical protein
VVEIIHIPYKGRKYGEKRRMFQVVKQVPLGLHLSLIIREKMVEYLFLKKKKIAQVTNKSNYSTTIVS